MAREPEVLTEQRRALGERLATFRQAADLTQVQLAKVAIVDRTTVAHVEKGRSRADERFWRAADDACGAQGALLAAFVELEAAKAEHEHQTRERKLTAVRAKAARFRAQGGELVVAETTHPLDPDEQVRIADLRTRPRMVDRAALRSLATMLAEQRRLEDVAGAGPLVQPMRAQLRLVENIVIDARGDIRADVVRIGGQYAQFTAWLHASLGEPRAAQYFYDRATEWALEADDPHMVATALSMKGHVAYRQGQVNSMLGLSRAAQRDKRQSPGVRALAVQQEARARALMGDRETTERRLDDAFVLAEQSVAHPEDEPPWVYFYSPEYLMMQRGRAYRYLGRFNDAAELLEVGLNTLAPELRSAEWAESYHTDLRMVREQLFG
jgi:transcriptional regulator with XRE-family HTH domain